MAVQIRLSGDYFEVTFDYNYTGGSSCRLELKYGDTEYWNPVTDFNSFSGKIAIYNIDIRGVYRIAVRSGDISTPSDYSERFAIGEAGKCSAPNAIFIPYTLAVPNTYIRVDRGSHSNYALIYYGKDLKKNYRVEYISNTMNVVPLYEDIGLVSNFRESGSIWIESDKNPITITEHHYIRSSSRVSGNIITLSTMQSMDAYVEKYEVKAPDGTINYYNVRQIEVFLQGYYNIKPIPYSEYTNLRGVEAGVRVNKSIELEAPNISIDNTIIKWFNVDNAVSYEIYRDGELIDIVNRGFLINEFKINGYGSYSVVSVASEESIYLNSVKSNSVTYDKLKIIFYQNSAESNRLDKTLFLVKKYEYEGTLRSATSITNPVIQIERFAFPECNYCYIPVFNRYYYINDIVSIRTNLWEMSMSVDALMSFKENIFNVKCMVARNEFIYDDSLFDSIAPVNTIPNYNTRQLYKSGFNSVYNINIEPRYYVMTFAGYIDDNNSVDIGVYFGSAVNKTYFLSKTELNVVLSKIYEENFWSAVGSLFAGDPTEGIISIKCYPIDFNKYIVDSTSFDEQGNIVQNYKSGFNKVSEISVPFGKNLTLGIDIPQLGCNMEFSHSSETIKISVPNEWQYLPPYAQYKLYIPFYGFIDVPPEYINVEFNVTWHISFLDGSSYIIIKRDTGRSDIQLECEISVDIPITHSGALERIGSYAQTAMKVVGAIGAGAVTSTIGSSVSNLKAGVEAGDRSIAGAAFQLGGNVVSKFADTYSDGTSSALSANKPFLGCIIGRSNSGFYLCDDIYYTRVYPSLKITEDEDVKQYLHLNGKPLNEIKTLNELNGFTVCHDFHLENFNGAFPVELNEIATALKTGILLPDPEE